MRPGLKPDLAELITLKKADFFSLKDVCNKLHWRDFYSSYPEV